MAENNWKMWIPHYSLENKYFICKAVDDEDGLQLFLISNDYTKKICVQFPGMVYAYRNRLELAALCTLDEITDKTGAFKAPDWTFFVVENSIYAKEIAKESQDIYPFSQLIHFAIVGGQALFEVITDALECLYSPLLMAASKAADELAIASVTRGIENPHARTCLIQIRFRIQDFLIICCFAVMMVVNFIGRGGAI